MDVGWAGLELDGRLIGYELGRNVVIGELGKIVSKMKEGVDIG